ncbi:xylose isomerase [Candidatus Pacearchaeota archaeon]|nr:xylose isomerase [Candidatus Pacearchaeota archaeon]
MPQTSKHNFCAWTFNDGKKGFTPCMRPMWSNLSTVDKIQITRERVIPRIQKAAGLFIAPLEFGFEFHYDNELNEENADDVAHALVEEEPKIYVGMTTPGAHVHYAFGGSGSLDDVERDGASNLGIRTVDLTYNRLRKAWHPDTPPTLVLWNGSWGYHLASPAIPGMRQRLKGGIAGLCKHEMQKGGLLYFAIEPKGNEGHAHHMVPVVGSAISMWREIEDEYGIPRKKKGVNRELGHDEMLGLCTIFSTSEEIDNDMLVHEHLNSQGGNDGISLGGPGKFDIDHEVKVTGNGIVIARMMQNAGYSRWCGHDMQPRPYDAIKQALERCVRAALAWEACRKAGKEMPWNEMINAYARRDTITVEDMMRDSLTKAHGYFRETYQASLS